jgi:hypothetical protein
MWGNFGEHSLIYVGEIQPVFTLQSSIFNLQFLIFNCFYRSIADFYLTDFPADGRKKEIFGGS